MRKIQSVQITYFSGTGGTARAAKSLRRAFENRAVAVTLFELNGQPASAADADCLTVLYPVYAANAPRPVEEWIATLPRGDGRPAAVISVSGGGEIAPNTACRVATIRRLEAKGYPVVYETMLVMPSNFLLPYGDALSALLLRAVDGNTLKIAEALLSGQVSRTHPYSMDRLLSWIFTIEKYGSSIFGKHLKATDRCVGCAWCERHCPRGNIALQAGKPVFGNRCVLCLRCVYGCPEHAIRAGIGSFAVLKQGFDLDAVEARTRETADFPPVETLAKGALYRGVRDYLKQGV